MSWLPIATVPKDGMFDVWVNCFKGQRHCNVVHGPVGEYVPYMTTAEGFAGRGCLRSIHDGGEVTHWMPIPGAPE